MVMNEAASARARRCGFGDEKRDADAFGIGKGVGVLPVARGDVAGAGPAVEGRVVPAAHLAHR
jgi:hypothetical protein